MFQAHDRGSTMTAPLRLIGRAALPILLLMIPRDGYARNVNQVDASNNVQVFYGIPMNLTIEGMKKLPYAYKTIRTNGKIGKYPAAIIRAADCVTIKVSFDTNGRLITTQTTSPNADVGRGIKIGSPLSNVRKAWPEGRLIYGVEENNAIVNFLTGTNIVLSFDPKDMPQDLLIRHRRNIPVPDMRVQRILIFASPVPIPKTCVPGYCA